MAEPDTPFKRFQLGGASQHQGQVSVGNSGQKASGDEFASYDLNKL